eukprot:CAMPEP_0118925544 /NCGR_PEP_ID=MMETSP1169-20130426/3429_1 /TAXON_ID=36882 /ORGANISM="Pyramimonas obovata, Strain CCMP722" /LENGTH=112 /DNA_ID=CAMNT_0006866879 /DNA_START=358 /DNA_END=692 /DNA_ORIENTATION=+
MPALRRAGLSRNPATHREQPRPSAFDGANDLPSRSHRRTFRCALFHPIPDLRAAATGGQNLSLSPKRARRMRRSFPLACVREPRRRSKRSVPSPSSRRGGVTSSVDYPPSCP